jgi:hypothetical protein
MNEAVDLVVDGEEMLCLARRLEALQLSLSPSRRLMRVLRPIVAPLAPAVLDTGHQRLLCRSIASDLVGDQDARWASCFFSRFRLIAGCEGNTEG